jgi:shikimate dehydrogenase
MQKLFTIFGNPVKHSRSPLMHNTVFKKLNYPACYTRSHLEDGTKLREQFVKLGLNGANITIPHKEAAYKACDEIRGFAKKVGVVNTIVYEDGKLVGYNTDADGFMYAISEFTSIKNVIILGAGGTAKALATRFLEEHMTVTVLNRSQGRLAYFNQIGCKTYTWENFDLDSYDLVVNTTSAGLNDDSLPAPIEYIEAILDSSRYAADAIYGKLTPFLQMAKEKKIVYKDGADMLLGQGVLANELFTAKQLSRKAIERAMRKSFAL